MKYFLIALFILTLMVFYGQSVQAEKTICKKDLQCWGEKHVVSASVYCKDYVEKLATYSHEWTDGFFDLKFSHFRWKDINEGHLTFIGDKIKFQNVFGAWQNHIYECDFDPINNFILDVRARPGRL